MQIFQLKASSPKVKLSSVVPKGFVITFERQKEYVGEYRPLAKILAEHMDIITESRELIREGRTVTWEEFYKKHAPKRRK